MTVKLGPPLLTASAAVYRYTPDLAARFTRKDNFGEPYPLYREVQSRHGELFLWVPRNMAPVGEVDKRTHGIPYRFVANVTPRDDEQQRVITIMREMATMGRSFVVQARPGFGKTVVPMPTLEALGRRALVIVDKEDLRDQWIEAARKFLGLGPRQIGIVQANRADLSRPFVVAMARTMARPGRFRRTDFDPFGVVLVDECHHTPADTFGSAMFLCGAHVRIGLSATPRRADGRDPLTRGHIGPVMVESMGYELKPTVTLLETGWKVPRYPDQNTGTMIPIPHTPGRLARVLRPMIADEKRNAMICAIVMQSVARNRKVIVFSDRVDHLDTLRAELVRVRKLAPHRVTLYKGGMTKEERADAQTRQVMLATYRMCSEGTDIPALDTCVLATPKAGVEQIVGRILRECEGKGAPRVFDLIDSDSWVLRAYLKTRRKYYARAEACIIDRTGD